jgi:thioredoxin-like negative regulator of GroEL
MALELEGLLAVHERLWEQRVAVLERWCEARVRSENAERVLERRRRAAEAELVRVSGGLSARQRGWAAAHSGFASRPRDRAGRQVLVKWIYSRQRREAAEAKWTATLAAARTDRTNADVTLATATTELLRAWGPQAPVLTGVSVGRLRTLARHAQARPSQRPSRWA